MTDIVERLRHAPDFAGSLRYEAADEIDRLQALVVAADLQNDGSHELLGFLAVHADRYQRDYGLDGLHPVHYDLMKKYGARMVDFKRATNASVIADQRTETT
jgi:hypothetical protein